MKSAHHGGSAVAGGIDGGASPALGIHAARKCPRSPGTHLPFSFPFLRCWSHWSFSCSSGQLGNFVWTMVRNQSSSPSCAFSSSFVGSLLQIAAVAQGPLRAHAD